MYPFIGIIRLKIDYRVLLGYGLKTTENIKSKVEVLREEYCAECLVVDTYDSDELVVIAFSQDMDSLYPYLDRIRNFTCHDIGMSFPKECKNVSKHIFASCHIGFGYDIDFSFCDTDKKIFKYAKFDDTRIINCLMETKPGHIDALCNILSEILICTQSMTTIG